MKKTFAIIFFLVVELCFANMASPVWEGTFSSSALSSRDIDILEEKIYLKIDKEVRTAYYAIEYFIRTDTGGRQIPLLFHAQDYDGDFKVWIDDIEVKLSGIPEKYTTTKNTPFDKFSNYFRQPLRKGEPETVVIFWENNSGFVYDLNDLKYFEADLSKGEHHIRVEYTARVWTDISGWVREYSFRYSLSPAKQWKSFGSLEITVDGTSFARSLTSNLGQPSKGQLDSIAIWNFSKLPGDYFKVNYVPDINAFAKAMIAVNPTGITLGLALSLILLHFFSVKQYRNKEPEKKHSWVVIVGSIITPFLILIGYIFSYDFIDYTIGVEASRYHGYTFMVMILYPVILPVYWISIRLVDKLMIRRVTKAVHRN